MRIPGEQRVHHSQGFLQVEDLIVTTVILAARQSQRRSGRVLEMVADDSQTLIQVLFDRGTGVRNLDAACMAFGEHFQLFVEVPIKLLFDLLLRADLLKVRIQQCPSLHILRRLLVQVADLVIRFSVCLVRLSQAALRADQFVPNTPQVVGSYVEVLLLISDFFPTPLSALSTLSLVLDAASDAKELEAPTSQSLPPLSEVGIVLQLV